MLHKKYLTIIIFLLSTYEINATIYYVKATGNDLNSGISDELAWQTISKVNYAALQPGDSVLFKRGDIFRGNLIPKSGSTAGYITYGAYGTGEKPRILGSVQKNDISHWELLSDNIWRTCSNEIVISENELLYNPDFVTDLSSWSIWSGNSSNVSATISRTTKAGEFVSDSAAIKIHCEENGDSPFNIQFWTAPYSIKPNTWYRFSFHAKASKEFEIPDSNLWLMKNTSPYEKYSTNSKKITINTQWQEYEILFHSTSLSTNTRINFTLGSHILDDTYLYIDSCSFKELENDPGFIKNSIGNIIFNDEAFCGMKMKNKADLLKQGDFWFDSLNMDLIIYSEINPALYYSNIELALNKHIISCHNKSYNIFSDLDLRYGSAHGISGNNTHHTIVSDVDFSFIGGGYLTGYGDGQVRYGNGVEFWNESSYNIVERCVFNEIFDAATTVQGSDYNTGYESHHIYFRNNTIKNSEWSFELWGRGENSYVHHVFFEHNTCINAGYGWGHTQRPDPSGSHLRISNFPAKTDSIFIRNNIFSESFDYSMCFFLTISDLKKKVKVDYNNWFESSGDIARIENTFYAFETDWESFMAISDFGLHAVIEEPLLQPDLSLNEESPCVDAGIISPNVLNDFVCSPRPSGSAPDIGAFEIQQPVIISNNVRKSLIKTYPNPISDHIYLEYPKNLLVERISVLDLNGRVIDANLSSNIIFNQNNQVLMIDLPNGIYLLLFVTNAGILTEKILIQ